MKISVLIITYNHEKYISKAIESVLMQKDCDAFEIIVCDDCSGDSTVTIARQLLHGIPNATIFPNEKNVGITKNYQQAFLLCSGDYIFVLEGDDYWTDSLKIRKQSVLLDKYPDCMSCSHFYYTEKKGIEALLPPVLKKDEPVTFFSCEDIILDPFIGNNFSTCCYRRSALQQISPATYEVISYEWMINISVSQFGTAAVINAPMSVYRISATGSWSRLSEKEQLNGIINILPDYDAILGHQYHQWFEEKKELLKQQLHWIEEKETQVLPTKRSVAIKRFIMSLFGK